MISMGMKLGIGGSMMMTLGMLIGPIGPISRHGVVMIGELTLTSGMMTDGGIIGGNGGTSGVGIKNSVCAGASSGSFGFSRTIGVCTIWQLSFDSVIIGSMLALGAYLCWPVNSSVVEVPSPKVSWKVV